MNSFLYLLGSCSCPVSAPITPDMKFIDLGSGVDQVVLQVAVLVTCQLCVGVEKAVIPANRAMEMPTFCCSTPLILQLFLMAVYRVAPIAKLNQQRGRRFQSAKEAEINEKKARDRGE